MTHAPCCSTAFLLCVKVGLEIMDWLKKQRAGNQHASTPKPNGWIKLLGSFAAKYTFFCVRKLCFTTTFGLKQWVLFFREFVGNNDSFSDADVFSTEKTWFQPTSFRHLHNSSEFQTAGTYVSFVSEATDLQGGPLPGITGVITLINGLNNG